jgi:hypothetical protein
LIYLHLQSMRNFTAMVERVAGEAGGQGEQASASSHPTLTVVLTFRRNFRRHKLSSISQNRTSVIGHPATSPKILVHGFIHIYCE